MEVELEPGPLACRSGPRPPPGVSVPLGVALARAGPVPGSLPFGLGFAFGVKCDRDRTSAPLISTVASPSPADVGSVDTREAPCTLTASERDVMSIPQRSRIIRRYF